MDGACNQSMLHAVNISTDDKIIILARARALSRSLSLILILSRSLSLGGQGDEDGEAFRVPPPHQSARQHLNFDGLFGGTYSDEGRHGACDGVYGRRKDLAREERAEGCQRSDPPYRKQAHAHTHTRLFNVPLQSSMGR